MTSGGVQAPQHHLLSYGARKSIWEGTLHNVPKGVEREGKVQAEGTQPEHRWAAGPGCWAAGQKRLVWGAMCYEITCGEAGGTIYSNPPGTTHAHRTSLELPHTPGPCT